MKKILLMASSTVATKVISTFVLMLTLTACATMVDPKNLLGYSSYEKFVVEEDIEYVEERGLAKVKWAESLKKGVYLPKYQDNKGYYFIGPKQAVTQKMGSNANWDKVFEGGIWKSKTDPNDMKIFYFLTYDEKIGKEAGDIYGGGAVYEGLMKAESNKYHFMIPNQYLLDRLNKAFRVDKK